MKNKLTRVLLILASLLLVAQNSMASGGVELKSADIDVSDKASLQRGIKLFTDYCLSCHGAKFVRFNRTADDLGLTEKQVMENLNHLGVKFGSTMTASMSKEYAKETFGAVPPDLSLVGRSRGADWLYSYLLGFYKDEKKSTGFNNHVFKDVGMPHVMWKLQEDQSEAEFETSIRDLVTFLSYIGEPRQLERKKLGIWVLIFLSFFFVLAYALKKEYWKDVH